MTSKLEKFNKTFGEFVKDLVSSFPDESEFRLVNMVLSSLRVVAPKVLHKNFHKNVVVPFGEKILAHDEGFFMETDYSKQIVGDVESLEEAERIITKVKQKYREMTESDRLIVWKYIRVLVILSMKINASDNL